MRPLYEIAGEIRNNWPKVHFAAVPYLRALERLGGIDETYGYDSARSIVRYFLSNARSWRGPVAKAIKAELKAMLE